MLEALSNNKEPQLMDTLYTVSTTRRRVLQWVPAQTAKAAASESQPVNALTYRGKCTIIKSVRKPATDKEDYDRLTRREQVVLSGLGLVTFSSTSSDWLRPQTAAVQLANKQWSMSYSGATYFRTSQQWSMSYSGAPCFRTNKRTPC